MNRTPGAGTTDLLLACLAALAGTAGLLTLAGHLTAQLTRQPPPTTGVGGGLAVLAQAATPGAAFGSESLNPVAYWASVVVLRAVVAGIGVARRVGRSLPASTAGMATRADIAKAASTKALLRRAYTLRPSIAKPTPEDVGYLLGHAGRHPVWASVEDSILILGPPRSRKGLHLVVNAILDAPGPVITTSTRPDTLHTTLAHSRRQGPTVVFDPQGLAPDVPAGLRWSPIRGCRDPLTAMIRARAWPQGPACPAGEWTAATSGRARPAPPSRPSSTPPPSTAGPLTTSTAGHSTPQQPQRPHAPPAATPTPPTAGPTPSTQRLVPTPEPATRSGTASPSPSPDSPTPVSSPPSPPRRASTSTPAGSSTTAGRCICSRPAPEPEAPPTWSRRSSRTSSRPPADVPPARRAPGWTRRCCSPSMRSATSPHSPHYPR